MAVLREAAIYIDLSVNGYLLPSTILRAEVFPVGGRGDENFSIT